MRHLIFALALCASSAAFAQDGDPPADTQPEPRFTAFQDVCIDGRASYAALSAAAAAHGWSAADESARPELPRVVGQARSYATRGMVVRNVALLSRVLVGEERGYLVLSEYENEGAPVIACSFFAFDAPQTVPGQLVRDWVGAPADDWREQPNRFVSQRWVNPPSMPGVTVFRHLYLVRAANAAPDVIAGMVLSIVASPAAYAPSPDEAPAPSP